MSEERTEPDQGPQGSGVLGNLPHSRPSVRSPRRNTEPPKRGAKPPGEAPEERAADEPAAKKPEAQEQPLDLEAIARGGIAVAGEAASLGLRLAGRAAAAMRDAVERR